ncbi:MAG TPA: peptidyl-prolyl cis-trans isomerase [Vicinamibacteria bacterium]
MRRHSFLLVVPSLLLAVSARGEVIERIVAKINGEIITLSEFQARQIAEAQGARIPPERVQGYLRDNNARILQEAIDDMLLVQRAQDTGLKMPPVDQYIEDIKKENKITSEEQFQEQLAREGMTLDELKRNMGRNILRRQILARDLEPKVMVTDTEVKAAYDARKQEFSHSATVQLREILVKGDDAQAKASELAAKARAGEDFGELAKSHSAAPSKASGGDLGKLARGEMNADLEKVAFSLPVGAVSDPIPSGEGYRVLKVEAKTDASITPFDEVKEGIRRNLGEARMNKELESYIANLREKAIIDVRVREVPQQLAGPTTAPVLRESPETPAGQPSEKPAAAQTAAPAPADDAEIVTTPQDRPEAVVPEAAPQPKRKEEPAPPTPPKP